MIKLAAILVLITLIIWVGHYVVNQNTHDDRKDEHGF